MDINKQFDRIIEECNQGSALDNEQIRGMLSFLAGHMKQLKENPVDINLNKINEFVKNQIKNQMEAVFNAFEDIKIRVDKNQENMKMELQKKLDKAEVSLIVEQNKITDNSSQLDLKIQKFIKEDIQKIQQRLKEAQQKLFGYGKNQTLQKKQQAARSTDILQNTSFPFLTKILLNSSKNSNGPSQLDALKWIDSNCRDFNKLLIEGNTITAKTQALVFSKQKFIGKNSFTVLFCKKGFGFSVGVIDTANKTKQYEDWNDNFLFYRNDKEYYFGDDSKLIGSGYNGGEKVKVTIDLSLGLIRWTVGQQIRHESTELRLKNNDISWVPFIALQQDDSVEIYEE